jgi:hypothetical protein
VTDTLSIPRPDVSGAVHNVTEGARQLLDQGLDTSAEVRDEAMRRARAIAEAARGERAPNYLPWVAAAFAFGVAVGIALGLATRRRADQPQGTPTYAGEDLDSPDRVRTVG